MMHGESLQARIWAHGTDRHVVANLSDICEHCHHSWHGLACRTTVCGCPTSWEAPAEDGAA